ncbi:uncharacterized protein LOC119190588 [Manduca sexta]|nr:uncharacterized protein LOC119190588 [Manduca sexta]
MKRDTSIKKISTEKENITNNVNELRNNVLLPLSNIINDKQKELEELLRVSENLIKIMRTYNNSFETSVKENRYNDTNSTISIYNFEIAPELENEFRRSDKNLLQKYLLKLKRDIYEVIRDIAGIQKLKGEAHIPVDLKILLRAMKRYVRNQAKLNYKEKKSDVENLNSRRTPADTKNDATKKTLVTEMVNILKVIDKNLPESNALASLSPTSRKIIQRVIKNNYIDEFSVIGLRVFDPEYNLTNDIKKIGTEWPRMTDIVAQTPIHDRLHAMKLLHLILSIDITKMNDALALLDFAYNRRMILIEGNLGGEIMDRINKGLKAINEKVKVIINLHKNRQIKNLKNVEVTKQVQKESFLKKLKKILRSSKNDIVGLLKKKVPKKEIVKGLAKKKIDELTRRRYMEFEDTMRKWQSKLNLVPRDKRFARDDNYKSHMKNILPKYLRGKVKPVIAAKKSKTREKQKKHSNTVTTTTKSKLTANPNTSKSRTNI